MKIICEYAEGTLYIRLAGELDHHTSEETMRQISLAVDRYLPRNCALDMTQLTFMDSSGIALVLRLKRRMQETGGEIVLIRPRLQPGRVLSASGVDRLVRIKTMESETRR